MSALLRRGADANAADAKGATALHVSVVTGHLEAVKLLINAAISTLDVNAQDECGDTPLHEAVAGSNGGSPLNSADVCLAQTCYKI